MNKTDRNISISTTSRDHKNYRNTHLYLAKIIYTKTRNFNTKDENQRILAQKIRLQVDGACILKTHY